MTRIAFIGIGTMGLPMAANLVKAGHHLVACDIRPERANIPGARSESTPAEAVAGAQLVLLSLPSHEAVESALFGRQGVSQTANPGTTVVDTSTTSPEFARVMASRLEALGLRWLDAPVSGGPIAAAEGKLTIMVGGPSEVLEECRSELRVLGEVILHVGGRGKGQAVKLCNNAVTGCTMLALAEACEIARRQGLEASALYQVLTHSTADSRVLRMRFPLPGAVAEHPSSHGYAALFSLDLETKDLALELESAHGQSVETPIIGAALAEFKRAQALGLGHLDYSAVFLGVRSPERGVADTGADDSVAPDSV